MKWTGWREKLGKKGLALLAIAGSTAFLIGSCTHFQKNLHTPTLKLQPPAVGIYQAAYPDLPEIANADWKPKIAAYEKLIGKKIAWATVLNDFADGPVFPKKAVTETLAAGTTPYLRILPRSKRVQGEGPEPVYQLELFSKGKFDAEIRQWCQEAAQVSSPLLVEFAQEANGDWYGWGGFWNGGGLHSYSETIPNGPYLYQESCRRFITICREEGARNLTWFFHLDSQPRPKQDWNHMRYYYPGDEYIDWIGLSVYGAQYPSDYWQTFEETLLPAYNEMNAMKSTRPMAILEMGVIENPKDPKGKAVWLKDALSVLRSGKYPRIKAINYWHEGSWVAKGDNNFRVDSTRAALESFLSEIQKPEFISEPVFK